jgi:outer membrane protein OmpA-like peptidoglycan-associated protein
MKKIFLMLALFSAIVSANAQIATENSNALDNLSVSGTFGVTTPLDFDNVFPMNTTFGFAFSKGITPVFGTQLEFLTSLSDNHVGNARTAFKNANIGVNGVLNISNIIGGYIGRPRSFEVSTVGGLGWHSAFDGGRNNISLKTGSDLAFNFGKKKIHSLVITPAIYWLLRNDDGRIQFNNHNALVSLMATYVYHFKNSNGTHHFKTYDIGLMNSEIEYQRGRIDQLKSDLKECMDRKPTVEKKTEVTINKNDWTVEFEQGKADLSDNAKTILNSIGQDIIVDVIGTASPEGTPEFNQMISESRAEVVANYLTKRGVRVNSWKGIGVQLNRLAIVKVLQ